jgi:uroporphyrin-3 C-methyltransferase
MYQELSSSRDQRLLAEVEQAVTLAACSNCSLPGMSKQHFIALENADARLAQELQPQFMPMQALA